MTDERSPIRIHILHCGSMLVSKAVPYGGGVNLKMRGAAFSIRLPSVSSCRFRRISLSIPKERCSSIRAGAAR